MITRESVCTVTKELRLMKLRSNSQIDISPGGFGAYQGSRYYSNSCLWFKTPSGIGPICSLSITFKMMGVTRNIGLRWALCENLDKDLGKYDDYREHDETIRYLTTTSTVSDTKQIQSGTWSFEQLDVDSGETVIKKLTIPTTSLKASTVYTLVFWPGGWSGTECYVSAEIPKTGDVVVSYIPGLVYIDNGSSLDAYHCYIDNGTSWDLMIPYIDNGSDWDMYT